MNTRKLIKPLFSISLLLALVWASLNYQLIVDQVRLWGYDPPTEIRKLADDTTMRDNTRRVFYANRPELQDKRQFSESCLGRIHSIVLGCYKSNSGIYILKVNEDQLDGVEEVTAAHEALHAIYDRMSGSEKERIDQLTAREFSRISNKDLKSKIEQYKKDDPSVVPDELHSILGTTIRELDPELEKHYSKYFKDRQRIVAFYESYETEFIARENRANFIKKQIESLKVQIDSINNELDSRKRELDAEFSSVDNTSQSEVEGYNAKVRAFNARVSYQQSLVASHNSLIAEYNAIVTEVSTLYEALDSRSKL